MDPSVVEALKVLGLPPNATLKEIKLAYKDLVTVWHPDRFANNPRLHEKTSEKLKELNLAYHTVMSFYQDMVFTERVPNVQEPPFDQEPEPTPFSPPDRPKKSFGHVWSFGLAAVVLIAVSVYFLRDHYVLKGVSLNALFPKSQAVSQSTRAAPSLASVVSDSESLPSTLQEEAALQPISFEETMPASLPEPVIEKTEVVQHTVAARADADAVKKKKVQKSKPLEVVDFSMLGSDEQSSIRSACSEAKLDGVLRYNGCLKHQLAMLAQGGGRPDLSRLTNEEKSSIEAVCSHAKFRDGPASYHLCLKHHLAGLEKNERRPDFSQLTDEEKSSVECVCSGAKMEGPSSYNACMSGHIANLARGERRPDLSRLTREEKLSLTAACSVAKMEGPVSYNRCLANHLKVHPWR